MAQEHGAEAAIEREVRGDVVILNMSGQMREMGADALREILDELLEKGLDMLIDVLKQ